jgi:hypothetical protein
MIRVHSNGEFEEMSGAGQTLSHSYYEIAGITVKVETDLPITDTTFHQKFELFKVDGPGEDNITIRHHFSLPDLDYQDLGVEVYRDPPWAIYKKVNSRVYLGISPNADGENIHKVVVVNDDHTEATVYSKGKEVFLQGGLHSLSLLPTDQILLARVLADRKGCYFHASGVIFEGGGVLFVGHSDAGKSTMVEMLKGKAEILCDDRVIVRRWPEGFRIHGTWSHGDVVEVSASSAPLRAILFLEHAQENLLIPLNHKGEITIKLLACLIKPLVTGDWWEKMLSLVEMLADEAPAYTIRFDKSGGVFELLRYL